MQKDKTIIESPTYFSINLKELWQYRELFYFFTWRDIKVKYKQTFLGIGWALLQPLALMFLFTFIFKRFDIAATKVRYEVYVLSGLIYWNFFYCSVSAGANSIVEQSNIIRKIYFPRLIIPFSSCLTALFDFFISFLIFIFFSILYQQPWNSYSIIFFPASLLLILLTAVGTAIFLSALTIKFRDFRYLIPFLLQFLFFASQVLYSLKSFENKVFRYLLAINPINGAIELFRSSFGVKPDVIVVLISTVSALVVFAIGIFYFRKTEAYFADIS